MPRGGIPSVVRAVVRNGRFPATDLRSCSSESKGRALPNVFEPLMIVLVVSLAADCGGGGEEASGPRPANPDVTVDKNGASPASATTGGSTAPEGTMAVKAARATQGEASGGARVETCDGGSIRLNAAENRLVELHNEARTQRGLEPLCVNPTLTEAARSHSEDMIEKDYFAHTFPGGESLGERLKRF